MSSWRGPSSQFGANSLEKTTDATFNPGHQGDDEGSLLEPQMAYVRASFSQCIPAHTAHTSAHTHCHICTKTVTQVVRTCFFPVTVSIQKISTRLSRFKYKNCLLYKSSPAFSIPLYWCAFLPKSLFSDFGIATMLGVFISRKSANSTTKHFFKKKSLKS